MYNNFDMFRSWEGVPRAKRSGLQNATAEEEEGSDTPMYLRRYEHFPEYYRYICLLTTSSGEIMN